MLSKIMLVPSLVIESLLLSALLILLNCKSNAFLLANIPSPATCVPKFDAVFESKKGIVY